MAETSESIQQIVVQRLSISRETELLHSFVRINIDNDAPHEGTETDEDNSLHQKKSEGKPFFLNTCYRIEVRY